MTGDLFVINSPRESSWISTVSDVASTWRWEHSDHNSALSRRNLVGRRNRRRLCLAGTSSGP